MCEVALTAWWRRHLAHAFRFPGARLLMATVVLQYAGPAVGTVLGGPLGAMIGRAAGAVAGSFIDQTLFGGGAAASKGPRLDDLRVMASTEGAPIPRIWGRMRVSGQVIWATDFEEVMNTSTEKTSAPRAADRSTKVTEYQYYANFAVALCEGEIARIGRVWADGKAFDLSERHLSRPYRQRDAGTRQPDRRQGGDGRRARLSRHRLCGLRAPAAGTTSAIACRSSPSRCSAAAGGARARGAGRQHHPGQHRVRLRHRDRDRAPATRARPRRENAHASALRSDWSVSLDDLTAHLPQSRGGRPGGDLVRQRPALRPVHDHAGRRGIRERRPSPTPGASGGLSAIGRPSGEPSGWQGRPMAARRPTLSVIRAHRAI